MNQRQRDLFLWQWSRRRQPGRAAILKRGAATGALGGLVFALVMIGLIDTSGRGGLASLLPLIEQGGLLLLVSVPVFAGIGWSNAYRGYSSHEAMYQSLLASGARVPERKPVLTAGDRGPMLAVVVTMVVMVALILALFIKFW
jgi:hypothetical protein